MSGVYQIATLTSPVSQVEKGRLAIDCPPEITKHLVDMSVGDYIP